MRSKNRSFWLLLAAVLLFVGIYPFSSSVGGGGVVPVEKGDAGEAPLGRSEIRDILKVFADAEERRLGNDKESQKLLRGILEALEKQTAVELENQEWLRRVAQNNQKIYELVNGENAAAPEQYVPAPANVQPLPRTPKKVSISINLAYVDKRYRVNPLSDQEIEVTDIYGNAFRWKYEPANEGFVLRIKDFGARAWMPCDLDETENVIKCPSSGIIIAAPNFPIPRMHKTY